MDAKQKIKINPATFGKRCGIKSNFGKRKPAKRKSGNFSVYRLNVLFGILALAGMVVNLTILNSATGKGYKIKAMEERIVELKAENQNLSLGLSDAQSMERVTDKLSRMGLVEARNIDYIAPPQTAVARK